MDNSLKRYITEVKLSDGLYESVSILAFTWKEAEGKVKLHNKFAINPIKLVGEWVEDIHCG
jgi:hypothetical protein